MDLKGDLQVLWESGDATPSREELASLLVERRDAWLAAHGGSMVLYGRLLQLVLAFIHSSVDFVGWW